MARPTMWKDAKGNQFWSANIPSIYDEAIRELAPEYAPIVGGTLSADGIEIVVPISRED